MDDLMAGKPSPVPSLNRIGPVGITVDDSPAESRADELDTSGETEPPVRDGDDDGASTQSHADSSNASPRVGPTAGRSVAVWNPMAWSRARAAAARAAAMPGEKSSQLRRRPGITIARIVFVAILCINLLGVVALRAVDSLSVANHATADLNVHLGRIEALLGPGGVPSLDQLRQLQTEMVAANADLQSLDNILPFAGALPLPQESAAHHALRLAIDALNAGQSTASLILQLAPSVQALVSTVVHGPSSPLPSGTHLFTVDDQAAAQAIFNNFAIPSWQAALADRRNLSAADLNVIHNQQLSAFVVRFDELAPKITLVLQVVKQLVDAAPQLVGILNPEHFLLLNMDTDELRATGGFLGNYADLEFVNGALVSGVHLHDVYTLDCPNNQCPNNPVPAQDAWFTIADGKFAMRDANLDPDFPTSANAIEQLYQHESGIQVDGVIAITPAVIASVLQVTGPVVVPQFNVTVTADNLRDLLHYYHQNPQIAQHLGISPAALGTSINKVFDVLAAQTVLAHLQTLTPSQQIALGRALLQDLTTKDIQLFSNVPHVQDLIVQTNVGGHVVVAPDDSLAVVDTNDGATYSNADLRESVVDQVALDGSPSGVQGAAHTLSITYDFPVVAHPYTQVNTYDDFVRVIVPNNANKLVVGGPCAATAVNEAYHQVLACQFSVRRGSALTLHFSWYVPNARSEGALPHYTLFVERQPGAVVQTQVSITPPTSAAFDPSAGPGAIAKGVLTWSANPLTSDTTLDAPLQGEGGNG